MALERQSRGLFLQNVRRVAIGAELETRQVVALRNEKAGFIARLSLCGATYARFFTSSLRLSWVTYTSENKVKHSRE